MHGIVSQQSAGSARCWVVARQVGVVRWKSGTLKLEVGVLVLSSGPDPSSGSTTGLRLGFLRERVFLSSSVLRCVSLFSPSLPARERRYGASAVWHDGRVVVVPGL